METKDKNSEEAVRNSRLFYLQLRSAAYDSKIPSRVTESEINVGFSGKAPSYSFESDYEGRIEEILRPVILIKRRHYVGLLLCLLTILCILYIDDFISFSKTSPIPPQKNVCIKFCLRNPILLKEPSYLSRSLSSFLLYSVSPFYPTPAVLNKKELLRNLSREYEEVITRKRLEDALKEFAPRCKDVVSSCELGGIFINGTSCCKTVFKSEGYELDGYCWTVRSLRSDIVFVLNLDTALSDNLDPRIISIFKGGKTQNVGLYLHFPGENTLRINKDDDLTVILDEKRRERSEGSPQSKYLILTDECRADKIQSVAEENLNCSLISVKPQRLKKHCSPNDGLRLFYALKEQGYITASNRRKKSLFLRNIGEHCLDRNLTATLNIVSSIYSRLSKRGSALKENVARVECRLSGPKYSGSTCYSYARKHFNSLKRNSGITALFVILAYILIHILKKM